MRGLSQDDIIRMAREVADIQTDSRGREEFIFDSYGIEAFANLVAAAEREACAEVCELMYDYGWLDAKRCAREIRARREQ